MSMLGVEGLRVTREPKDVFRIVGKHHAAFLKGGDVGHANSSQYYFQKIVLFRRIDRFDTACCCRRLGQKQWTLLQTCDSRSEMLLEMLGLRILSGRMLSLKIHT